MSRQKGLQSQRWTDAEEKLLVSAWLNASEDLVVGTSQKQDSFLQKIANYFNEYCPPDRKRDKDALNKKWKSMSGNVVIFAGCYDHKKDRPVSGFTEQDYIKAALEEYKEACNGKDFKHLSSWEVLRNHSKWKDFHNDSEKGKKRRSNSVEEEEEEDNNRISTVEVRPMGQKAAKRLQREAGNKVSTSTKLEVYKKYQKQMTTAMERQNELMAEQNQIMKDQMVNQLLAMNKTKMDPEQRLLYELQVQRMVSQMSTSAVPSNNSGNFHSELSGEDIHDHDNSQY